MKLFAPMFVCALFVACSSSATQPSKLASDPSTSAAAAQPEATKPDTASAVKHLREHVKYPASRSAILASCADTPEFSTAEKRWFSNNLPEKTYASADEVVTSLHL